MTPNAPAALRAMFAKAGLGEADLVWLDSFGFDDAAVPPVESEGQAVDYERRAKALLASIQPMPLWERESAPASKLAAAIGARVADWRDRESGDEEE